MTLQSLGWSAFFEAHLEKSTLGPCRVISEGTDRFLVHDGSHEKFAMVRGRVRNSPLFPPVVGDWVLAQPADDEQYVIESILPRRTAMVRKRAGPATSAQVLAANVDRVLLVTSMNQDFSVRRLERYLTLVWESGATPIIVLTKSDLVDDDAPFRREAERCALGFPLICASSITGAGVDELRSLLAAAETMVLIGSSGVGKSTLVNALAGADLRPTRNIRVQDGKGRHATSDRHLIRLPSGVLLIDTPGLREVQLWASDAAVEETFPEISATATYCRFRDCQHTGEPGCGVLAAIQSGEIDADRLASMQRLRREVERLERERDPLAASEHKRKIRSLFRAVEKQYRQREKP
jgi:ribosome biogenesis GTPase / thiamine phosphate phosphatase